MTTLDKRLKNSLLIVVFTIVVAFVAILVATLGNLKTVDASGRIIAPSRIHLVKDYARILTSCLGILNLYGVYLAVKFLRAGDQRDKVIAWICVLLNLWLSKRLFIAILLITFDRSRH